MPFIKEARRDGWVRQRATRFRNRVLFSACAMNSGALAIARKLVLRTCFREAFYVKSVPAARKGRARSLTVAGDGRNWARPHQMRLPAARSFCVFGMGD